MLSQSQSYHTEGIPAALAIQVCMCEREFEYIQ